MLPCPRRPGLSYLARLRSLLTTQGPFDVVHSHVHNFSGIVLAVAASAGIPVRIAHSHNALMPVSSSLRRLYLFVTARLVAHFATSGLAASGLAAEDLFGASWQSDARWAVQHCAIDLGPFCERHDRGEVRRELGVAADDLVIGHVGRFDPQKNHALLVRIAAELCGREPRARFVLVGDGPLRRDMEREVKQLGLDGRVRFLGVRGDVPRVLRAFDAFLFPSHHEGLGLAGVEAQAAGVPVLLSSTIPREVEVVTGLVRWQRLDASPSEWATLLQEILHAPRIPQPEALVQVKSSPFDISRSLRDLEKVYGAALES